MCVQNILVTNDIKPRGDLNVVRKGFNYVRERIVRERFVNECSKTLFLIRFLRGLLKNAIF